MEESAEEDFEAVGLARPEVAVRQLWCRASKVLAATGERFTTCHGSMGASWASGIGVIAGMFWSGTTCDDGKGGT